MVGNSRRAHDLFDDGDDEDFFSHDSSQVATYSPPVTDYNPPPAVASMRAAASRMGAPASRFRALRPERMEGGGGLDLNSEAAAVPSLFDFNSQADPYIVGDCNSPDAYFPGLSEYQQFLQSKDVPTRGCMGKAASASQPRHKNASGGATRASSAVTPSQGNASLPPRARRDGPARGGRGTMRGSHGTSCSGSCGRRSTEFDYDDGSTTMATEHPMLADAFMVDSGEDDDDSDEVIHTQLLTKHAPSAITS
jgi:hypothetical protein